MKVNKNTEKTIQGRNQKGEQSRKKEIRRERVHERAGYEKGEEKRRKEKEVSSNCSSRKKGKGYLS